MWENIGKTDMSYMKDSCYSEDSDGRHALFIAFDLLVVIGFFISLLVIIYVTDGKEPMVQHPGVVDWKSRSSNTTSKQRVLVVAAKAAKHVEAALKKKRESKKLSKHQRRMLRSNGDTHKIDWPTESSTPMRPPPIDRAENADRFEQDISAVADAFSELGGNPDSSEDPKAVEISAPSTLVIDLYKPIEIDWTTGSSGHKPSRLSDEAENADNHEKDTSATIDVSSEGEENSESSEDPKAVEKVVPSTFINDFHEPIDHDETTDIASISKSKGPSQLMDAFEQSEKPPAKAPNADDTPSERTETDLLEISSVQDNGNAPAEDREVIPGVNNKTFSVVDGMIDPTETSAGNLTGRRRQSTAFFSKFPVLGFDDDSSE